MDAMTNEATHLDTKLRDLEEMYYEARHENMPEEMFYEPTDPEYDPPDEMSVHNKSRKAASKLGNEITRYFQPMPKTIEENEVVFPCRDG
jgi:hypothetical protein